MRVLVVGWSSPLHGEATAGDVLAMDVVSRHLERAGIGHDTAWSAVMCPPGGLLLEHADPGSYTHLVFVCGPATGEPVREILSRFSHCRRVAVDVTVVDTDDPVVAMFDEVIARDAPGAPARRDLSAQISAPASPVAGVYLTAGQHEYGERRGHDAVVDGLVTWLTGLDAALLELDTRLDPRDWRLPTGPGHVSSVLARLDVVITMRMHGLVLALHEGVPAVAVDPVLGGGKVSAQAAALGWPAVIAAEDLTPGTLDRWWRWCLSDEGRDAARALAGDRPDEGMLDELLSALTRS